MKDYGTMVATMDEDEVRALLEAKLAEEEAIEAAVRERNRANYLKYRDRQLAYYAEYNRRDDVMQKARERYHANKEGILMKKKEYYQRKKRDKTT